MRGYCLQEIGKGTILGRELDGSVTEIDDITCLRIYQKHSNIKINLPRNIIEV